MYRVYNLVPVSIINIIHLENQTPTELIANFKQKFIELRSQSVKICSPLKIEDYVVQPIVDVSPPKWHLGHTTSFFETFILVPNKKSTNYLMIIMDLYSTAILFPPAAIVLGDVSFVLSIAVSSNWGDDIILVNGDYY